MNYKSYPDSYWSIIESQLKSVQDSGEKAIAAFDADGTLWDVDAGENFFQYQIEHKLVELPSSPYEYYLELKKKNNNPCEAFMWLAQINNRKNITDVRSWAEKAFKSIQPQPYFSEQKKLIDLLLKNNVEIFIVTASVTWAIEYGAQQMGIHADHVLGVETEIMNGLVTDKALYPVTYQQGKSEALLKKTSGQRPFLSSGNTMGDFDLLNQATHIRLAVSATSADDSNYRTEMELQKIAQKNNWLNHRFI